MVWGCFDSTLCPLSSFCAAFTSGLFWSFYVRFQAHGMPGLFSHLGIWLGESSGWTFTLFHESCRTCNPTSSCFITLSSLTGWDLSLDNFLFLNDSNEILEVRPLLCSLELLQAWLWHGSGKPTSFLVSKSVSKQANWAAEPSEALYLRHSWGPFSSPHFTKAAAQTTDDMRPSLYPRLLHFNIGQLGLFPTRTCAGTIIRLSVWECQGRR